MTTTDAALAGVTKMSREEALRFYMETYGVDTAEAEKMLMISHPRYRKDTVERPAPRRYKRRSSSSRGGNYPALPLAARDHESH